MKILEQFIKWSSKTGSENKKKNTAQSEINTDIYKRIRQIYKEQQEKFEKNKRLVNSMSTSVGHLPSSVYVKSSINNNTITASAISNSAVVINSDPTNGNVKIDVPLYVNGRDVMKELDEMRDALLLLKRDVDMEQKYPRLKEIKDEYERALEKYKTFDIIKESK